MLRSQGLRPYSLQFLPVCLQPAVSLGKGPAPCPSSGGSARASYGSVCPFESFVVSLGRIRDGETDDRPSSENTIKQSSRVKTRP